VQKEGDKTKVTKVPGGGLMPGGAAEVSEESVDIIKAAVRSLRNEYDDSKIRSLGSDLEQKMASVDKYVQNKQKDYSGDADTDDVEIITSGLELSTPPESDSNSEFDKISASFKQAEILYNRAIVIKWISRDFNDKEAFKVIAQGLTINGQTADQYILAQKQQGKTNEALVVDIKQSIVDYITVVLVEKMYQKL
jgi:hypothetical protein